ncbi:MAG: hypothetical protein J1F02_00940 [Lachnospiraceae bacterium]|nr:hypothetical protein [Lachnospiraceae bacterium]
MRKTKKSISVFLVLVMGICMLTGCKKDLSGSQYVGTYQLVGLNGQELTQEQQEAAAASLVLNSDGTVTLTVGEQSDTGKWEENDNGVTISNEDGGSPVEFTMSDGKLTGAYSGMEMVFQK